MKLAGSVHISHPSARDRESGQESRAYLMVDRGLKSGRLEELPLSKAQLLDLIATGARVLQTLSKEAGR